MDISIDNIELQKDYNNIKKYLKDKEDSYEIIELVYNIKINKFVFDLYGNVNLNNNIEGNANSFNKWVDRTKINLHEHSKKLINYLTHKNLFSNHILPKL